MKYLFNKKLLKVPMLFCGFTLAEAIAAIIILGLICTTTLVVINNIMLSAADETLKMQAFQVVRENMEKLLASGPVKESIEYGTSEQHPQITWQTTVESFYEPLTTRLWIQAVCKAEYFDSAGYQQNVELTNWLTDVSKQQIIEMLKNKEQKTRLLIDVDQILQTIQEASSYIGVDQGTIQEWVNNGMPITEEGYFIKAYLELYRSTSGDPTIEDRMQVEEFLKELIELEEGEGDSDTQTDPEGTKKNGSGEMKPDKGNKSTGPGDEKSPRDNPNKPKSMNKEPKTESTYCGLTMAQLERMSFDELWEFVKNCDELSL